MRILHADLEAGTAFEQRSLDQRTAAHPECHRKPIGLEPRKLDVRLSVEVSRLPRASRTECHRARHLLAAAQVAIKRVMREQAIAEHEAALPEKDTQAL